ncbi:TerB family tellurite resistance protein (plasmid) [Ralstonia solanacearum]|uniref:TerB family tellurite resistance protein n=1 Tax=Ralstonia solanacearum TaxID=305 RepID=UPI0032169671
MRTYLRNSPEAAARIVALVLTADGHVCSTEDRALERLQLTRKLGLAPSEFTQVVQTLCEDRLRTGMAERAYNLDADTLGTLLSEVESPGLRRKVLRLCFAVALADEHLADGEIAVLGAIMRHWYPHEAVSA